MKNTWRITAIIFIILFVLETAFLIYAYNLGVKEIERENECMVNVCSDYDAYSYDETLQECSCFIKGVEDPMLIRYIR